MPVLNGEKYLKLAIESILSQSYKDFEFIIIDDGSTDKTEQIIKSYKDPRIVYIKNPSNLGLSKSYNIGIKVAQGQYVTRMDADDISTKNRFEKQLNFLIQHKSIGIVGSSVTLIDENDKQLKIHSRPTNHLEIKWASLFSTPLVHPSIMGYTEIFKKNPYDENLKNSEDYELWSRLLFTTNVRLANIQEPLLLYRLSSNSFTQKLNTEKRATSARNTIKNLERYISLSEQDEALIVAMRQDKSLSALELWTIWKLYLKAAISFCHKENIKFPENLQFYSRLIALKIFLIKHKIKHWR